MRIVRGSMKQIWVLCGGPSTEYEVSLSSGRCVCRAIHSDSRQVRPVIVTRQGSWLISDRVITGDEPRTWVDEFFESSKAEWNQPVVDLPAALTRMVSDGV